MLFIETEKLVQLKNYWIFSVLADHLVFKICNITLM